jgi:hypothetical protein
VHFKLSV